MSEKKRIFAFEERLTMIDSSILQDKKAAYFTLGCKLNFAETSSVAQELKRYGVKKAQKGEAADICIINTCSVTDMADHKCRQAIHRLVKQNPNAFVVVTGCYAQLKPQDIIPQKAHSLSPVTCNSFPAKVSNSKLKPFSVREKF